MVYKIKPKDKATLDKINLHRERLDEREDIDLKNYERKTLYNKYEVLLLNLCTLETENNSDNSIKYILETEIYDVHFVFNELEDMKFNKNSYTSALTNNENLQILNNDMLDVIVYRKVEETSKFYMTKFYEFEEVSDLTLIAKFSCNNNKSDEWESAFLEIFNSIKKVTHNEI